jgi:serine protease Do
MNRKCFIAWSALALLVIFAAAQPAGANQNPADVSAAVAAQASAQAEVEVQAALAKAQAEVARAIQDVNAKTAAKVRKEIAAKLATHRGAMLADLHAAQAELAALAQEKATRTIDSQFAFEDSESGWLGVQIADVDAEKVKELKLLAERGVLITEVEKESPAEKAGLKANDVITEYNGQRIESAAQFRRMVRESLAGRAAQLTVWREARAQTISVTLGSNSDRIGRAFTAIAPREFKFNGDMFKFDMPNVFVTSRAPLLGISAEDISGQLGNYFGAPGGEGILVREVNAGSPAEKAGLKAGDVITKLNGERVKSLDELREKLRARGSAAGSAANREQKTVSIGVLRKGAEMSFNVEVEQPKARPAVGKRIARRMSL